MIKRVLRFMVALVAAVSMMVIPASAATGGLSANAHEPGGVSASTKHHKSKQTEPAKPIASEPFSAESMEVLQIVESTSKAPVPPASYILGFAEAYFPAKDKITVRFLAKYGSFESRVDGGGNSKYGSSPDYYSQYILPPESDMPASGYDTAWMVIMDRTKHTFVESEHVRFNILQPENIRHPVG